MANTYLNLYNELYWLQTESKVLRGTLRSLFMEREYLRVTGRIPSIPITKRAFLHGYLFNPSLGQEGLGRPAFNPKGRDGAKNKILSSQRLMLFRQRLILFC